VASLSLISGLLFQHLDQHCSIYICRKNGVHNVIQIIFIPLLRFIFMFHFIYCHSFIPYTWAQQELHRPRMKGPFCAKVGSLHLPSTPHTRTWPYPYTLRALKYTINHKAEPKFSIFSELEA